MTLKLYELCSADADHLFSPHCWKIRMALAHKGLPFESVSTPFTNIAGVEAGEKRKVPVLRDGDTVVEESFEIARYLDAKYPDAPSLLGGPGGEALTQFVISWSMATLHPEVTKVALMDIYESLAPDDQVHFRTTREIMLGCTLEEFAAKFPKDGNGLAKALNSVEKMLARQAYFGGESPLFADYVVFGALQWARLTCKEQVVPQTGAVAQWMDRLLDMYEGMGRKAKAA
ncbi:MAG: glutathione S-transferase family protein [Pseudomonadota bacterium]